jgi:lipopolysaccharide/colanic/teichoic acid biosynthesis glycosyltransferase
MYLSYVKPFLDVLIAFTVILLGLPLHLFIAALLYVCQQQQIFFLQKRVGKNARIFTLFKFKTMLENYDEAGKLLPDELRTTKIGFFLRKAHLDELPQCWNILCGNMSWVGPRPLLPEYLPHYTPLQQKRHLVKPGITGLAQIKGGNALSWKNRLRYDTFYATHTCWQLDIYIVFKTIQLLFQPHKNIVYSSKFTENNLL